MIAKTLCHGGHCTSHLGEDRKQCLQLDGLLVLQHSDQPRFFVLVKEKTIIINAPKDRETIKFYLEELSNMF